MSGQFSKVQCKIVLIFRFDEIVLGVALSYSGLPVLLCCVLPACSLGFFYDAGCTDRASNETMRNAIVNAKFARKNILPELGKRSSRLEFAQIESSPKHAHLHKDHLAQA